MTLGFLIHEHVLFIHLGLQVICRFIGIFVNRNSFIFPFLIGMPCISVSCLTAMAKTSIIMLTRSGEYEHSCLNDFREIFLALNYDINYVCFF